MQTGAARPLSRPHVPIALLGLLSAFPPLSTDLYLSAFGRMQAEFAAADGAMELTLSVFFLGLGLGQLIYGPAIDAYGRRRPLLIGAAVYCAATAAALVAADLEMFIAMRFVQALGAASGMIIARAIISDLYTGRAAARAQTLVMMVVLLGPIFAPLLGGLIVTVLPWRATFGLMLAMGLAALALGARMLPETLPPARRAPLRPGAVLARWGGLMRSGDFLTPALTGGLAMGVVMSFIAGSSALFMDRFGLSEMQYGIAFGGIAAGLLVASRLNVALLERMGPGAVISAALPLQCLGALGLLAAQEADLGWALVAPLWLAVACSGCVGGNAAALAMGASRGGFGAGSALMGALQFGLAFAVTALVGMVPGGAGDGMAAGMVCASGLAVAVWFLGGGARRAEEGIEDGIEEAAA